jgi:hypothetical protein
MAPDGQAVPPKRIKSAPCPLTFLQNLLLSFQQGTVRTCVACPASPISHRLPSSSLGVGSNNP